MNKLKLPRGTQLINCSSIEFTSKGMVVIDKWEDFLWIVGNCVTIYKLQKSFYHIGPEVCYIYNLNGDKIE